MGLFPPCDFRAPNCSNSGTFRAPKCSGSEVIEFRMFALRNVPNFGIQSLREHTSSRLPLNPVPKAADVHNQPGLTAEFSGERSESAATRC